MAETDLVTAFKGKDAEKDISMILGFYQ